MEFYYQISVGTLSHVMLPSSDPTVDVAPTVASLKVFQTAVPVALDDSMRDQTEAPRHDHRTGGKQHQRRCKIRLLSCDKSYLDSSHF